jgi:hypothetical protein
MKIIIIIVVVLSNLIFGSCTNSLYKKGVKNFICSVNYNIYSLFNIKLGVLDRYDSITQSEQQGFVDLHSSTRNKKMAIKLGRLVGKLGVAFNEAISKNPKNKPYKIKDELIEKIHNQWMSVNADGLKYDTDCKTTF